jgi:anthranilate synthase component 1
MFRTLSKEEFLVLATKKPYVAVYKELMADTFTPISALESLVVKENNTAMLLESGLKFHESGSYSFLGINPYATFMTKNGVTTVIHGDEQNSYQDTPLPLLRNFHQKFSCVHDEHSKLVGQMMGFLAYDAVHYFEQIPDHHVDDSNIPDILFHFYRINLVFNHETNKILIAVIAESTSDYEKAYADIENIIEQLQQSSPSISLSTYAADANLNPNDFQTDCDDAQYEEKVRRAKEFIHSGDVFQLVLSRTFFRPIKSTPLSIYRILRHSNPTPYLFYLTMPELILFGASPEKVVSMENKVVTIAPIAGTIPVTDESTEILAQRLRDDPKEHAEHMMLVDLARNDIGAVCEPGSVYVSDLMVGERLTHVMHLVSYVKGKLAAKYDAFDLLKSAFPAGTLSGTPKIRAMELIDELESSKRHLYGGAICKIDSEGNLDSCIVIRSGVVKGGVVHVRAGAGVVFDSNPAAEALETRNKAKGVFKSVMAAESEEL